MEKGKPWRLHCVSTHQEAPDYEKQMEKAIEVVMARAAAPKLKVALKTPSTAALQEASKATLQAAPSKATQQPPKAPQQEVKIIRLSSQDKELIAKISASSMSIMEKVREVTKIRFAGGSR